LTVILLNPKLHETFDGKKVLLRVGRCKGEGQFCIAYAVDVGGDTESFALRIFKDPKYAGARKESLMGFNLTMTENVYIVPTLAVFQLPGGGIAQLQECAVSYFGSIFPHIYFEDFF
jgi:hypothetical protein